MKFAYVKRLIFQYTFTNISKRFGLGTICYLYFMLLNFISIINKFALQVLQYRCRKVKYILNLFLAAFEMSIDSFLDLTSTYRLTPIWRLLIAFLFISYLYVFTDMVKVKQLINLILLNVGTVLLL